MFEIAYANDANRREAPRNLVRHLPDLRLAMQQVLLNTTTMTEVFRVFRLKFDTFRTDGSLRLLRSRGADIRDFRREYFGFEERSAAPIRSTGRAPGRCADHPTCGIDQGSLRNLGPMRTALSMTRRSFHCFFLRKVIV